MKSAYSLLTHPNHLTTCVILIYVWTLLSQAFGDMHLFSLGWTQLSTNCVVWPTLSWLPLFFDSSLRTVRHGRTFNSFPSVMYPNLFPTCHASDLFYKLLNLKQKIQEKLNTRGMSKRNQQVVSIENFDVNAWAYVLKCCPVQVSSSMVVVKSIYMNEDECHVEKRRETQQSFTLTLPNHLPYAQHFIRIICWNRCSLHAEMQDRKATACRNSRQN